MIYQKFPESPIADNITFIVTDDCNLKCRYCYEKDKTHNKMNESVGLKAVDFFFNQYNKKYDSVVFDFIGGEPFLEISLITKLTEKILEYNTSTKKWKSIIFNFSTNGTLFSNPKVIEYANKFRKYVSIGLSMDGTKEIHDYNRSDSFDKIMYYFSWWKNNFPYNSTKGTIDHHALRYLSDSIKFLLSLKISSIFMNTVYEDIWEDGDDEIYTAELKKAADYILSNKTYKKQTVSLFDLNLLKNIHNKANWCGCGSSMIAVDYLGDLYPCLRFKTLSKQKPLIIGNIMDGIDYKKLLPFYFCHNIKNNPGCDTCEYSSGCPNCTAFCYDETGSIFDRTGYMCKMHKARVEVNKLYWHELANIEGIEFDDLK